MRVSGLILLIGSMWLGMGQLMAATERVTTNLVTTLAGPIWGMSFVDDKRLLVTLKQGEVWLVDTQTGQGNAIAGAPDVAIRGQGGLLDVAVGPNFSQEGWVYFTFAQQDNGQATTTLARAQWSDNRLQAWQTLLLTKAHSNTGQHFGSRIAFDDQGHVFFSVGDRGDRQTAQDLTTHAGSILRLHLDGSIPSDNPFVNVEGALPEIWSYGHRNPQGLWFDHVTRTLWSVEHGPRGGDELNVIERGANYGWPVVSFGKEYWGPIAIGEGTEKTGMVSPIKVYVPSIAPSFLIRYRGAAWPQWQGDFLIGALAMTHLNRVRLQDQGGMEEQRYLEKLKQRIRSGAVSRQGDVYLGTDSGQLLRLIAN